MQHQSLLSSVYAALVLSACFIQGYSLPQRSYSAEEFSRKFGSSPSGDLSNSIEAEDSKLSLEAKEDGGLLTTVLQLAVKFVPTLINVISGETGPSQTDRIEGIDLNGEDPFSWRNIALVGLKLFLAIAGGSSGANEKSDNPIEQTVLQPVMGAVIQALTGSTNRDEVSVMAKQATEVASLVISLAQALATSMSQKRSFDSVYAAEYIDGAYRTDY